MTETVTVRGFVGSDVRHVTTDRGLPISTFRVGSTSRRFDRESGRWVDGDTNWFTVTCFRALAQNVQSTLRKGDPVVVSGRLRVRRWENDAGTRGTAVEIDADGLGHDLTFGTGSFTRISPAGQREAWSSSDHRSSQSGGPEGPNLADGSTEDEGPHDGADGSGSRDSASDDSDPDGRTGEGFDHDRDPSETAGLGTSPEDSWEPRTPRPAPF